MVQQYEKHITVITAHANCITALLLCIETVSVFYLFENNDVISVLMLFHLQTQEGSSFHEGQLIFFFNARFGANL